MDTLVQPNEVDTGEFYGALGEAIQTQQEFMGGLFPYGTDGAYQNLIPSSIGKDPSAVPEEWLNIDTLANDIHFQDGESPAAYSVNYLPKMMGYDPAILWTLYDPINMGQDNSFREIDVTIEGSMLTIAFGTHKFVYDVSGNKMSCYYCAAGNPNGIKLPNPTKNLQELGESLALYFVQVGKGAIEEMAMNLRGENIPLQRPKKVELMGTVYQNYLINNGPVPNVLKPRVSFERRGINTSELVFSIPEDKQIYSSGKLKEPGVRVRSARLWTQDVIGSNGKIVRDTIVHLDTVPLVVDEQSRYNNGPITVRYSLDGSILIEFYNNTKGSNKPVLLSSIKMNSDGSCVSEQERFEMRGLLDEETYRQINQSRYQEVIAVNSLVEYVFNIASKLLAKPIGGANR